MEGNHCFNPSSGCDMSGKVAPIAEYSHATDGIAVIGGYFYKGSAIPALANAYIFGDLNGKIWSLLESPANTWTRTLLLSSGKTISSFGQDTAGEVYVVDLSGSVLKLAAQ